MPQWSTTMTVTCLYILFIMIVLSISFPLKSHKSKSATGENERENGIGFYNDDDAIGLGANEQKLLQRAHDLSTVNNRTDILREAFGK